LLAYCVAEGACEKRTVFILVGENPDDVRMRWIGLAEIMKFDINNIDVHFVPGVFPVSTIRKVIADHAEAKKCKIGLLIVDTSAAYFPGNDENSNTQLGGHARAMREAFVELPGHPCVVVTNHPTKSPDMDNLLPRGGGAYVAEVDGNLVAIRSESVVTVHWHGKFRGPDFEPMPFELAETTAPGLIDSKGRQIPTVVAKALDEDAHASLQGKKRIENNLVLKVLAKWGDDAPSLTAIAADLGWRNKQGEANKERVRRAMNRLRQDKLVRLEMDQWHLTEAGKKAAARVDKKEKTP
jgi:hypothetical protein